MGVTSDAVRVTATSPHINHDNQAVKRLLESQSETGDAASKTAGLAFRDLTVTAPGGTMHPVKTLPHAILNTFGPDQFSFFNKLWHKATRAKRMSPGVGRELLAEFTGLVNPGEMLLVLGRPGSGCSTFLRTAANRSTLHITGDLQYGKLPAATFTKHHARETIYLPEEDQHIASLTVRETIQFALRTSLPPRAVSHESINTFVESIAALFGLGHALETSVGGAFFPGVSGGERKRVSIAEVFATGSLVQCFDNSTRGLDASTALDFVKALRVLTDAGRKTTLATLYQAGEEIYNHFDKVILIDQGREIFFGPTVQARTYFEELGFSTQAGLTTSEFLVSMLDPELRSAAPGSRAANISTVEDLASAFRGSPSYADLLRQIDEQPHSTGLKTGTSAYILSYPLQIVECLRRELQLVRRQATVYKTKWVTTLILCFVVGSIYYNISNDSQGVFTRGSILYFVLIFNGWLQFPELFDAHTNRAVLERQAHLHLYRPSAVALARFLMDLPLIAFQHVLCALPFYFLSRLQLDAGKFFFFYLTLFLSTVNFSNLLRMFAYFVHTLDDCFRYGGFSCTVLLLYAGFLIPAADMRPIFGWIHWINPMFYAFENMLVNELEGLHISCSGSLVPSIVGANIDNQVCAVVGAVAGRDFVSGDDYIRAQGLDYAHRWRNIGILIAIALVYLMIGAVGSELMSFTSQGGNPMSFIKRPRERISSGKASGRTPSDASLAEKSGALTKTEAVDDNGGVETPTLAPRATELTLSWTDITVDIGEKRILKGITGYSRRGAMTALCGASGAGKTTLLSHLSKTAMAGTMGGDVRLRGRQPGTTFRKITGFAQQNDLHDGTATVREALEFSALLRQPKYYSKQEKLAYVDDVLGFLDLKQYENVLIGDDNSGLGVEQKKRVTIGVELVARPEVLFVDEPTSGLDSQGALSIVSYLRSLAHRGQAILVTIHQPSALLFSSFDNLLVLSSEGEQIYFGDAKRAIDYFGRAGSVCPPNANPAEFILNTIGAGVNARTNDAGKVWADTWSNSPEAVAIVSDIASYNERVAQAQEPNAVMDRRGVMVESTYNAPVWLQTKLLTERILKNQWRNPPYIYSKIWVHVLSGILVGLTFFGLGTSPSELQNRTLSVYFMLFLVNAIVNVILIRFFFQTLYWRFREGPSSTYGWIALCTSSILAEMPAALVCGTIYFVLWYFPSGLPYSQAGYIFLCVITYEIFQVLLGLFMMALSPDLGFAGNVLVFIVCICNWMNGIIVPYDQIQVFWRYWLYYLSPYTYFLGGMVTAVTQGVPVVCGVKDLVSFAPPAGQSCASYAGQWAVQVGATIINPNATSACQVCKWTSGDQFLEGYHLGPETGLLHGQWAYWAVFAGFTVSNLFLVYFFTWVTKVKGWKAFYFF